MTNGRIVQTKAEAEAVRLELGPYSLSTIVITDEQLTDLVNGKALAFSISHEYTVVIQYAENRLGLSEEESQ